MTVPIQQDGTAWVHDFDAARRQTGSVFAWPDDRSETGMLSGIVIDRGMLCVRVRDIRAAIIKRSEVC